MARNYVYDYSGKPSGTLTLPLGKYTTVVPKQDPPNLGGLEFKMLYLNVDLTWPPGESGSGNLRVRFVRDGGDATAYQDYPVDTDTSSFLITQTHFEIGERGVSGKWQVKPVGDMSKAKATTRYSKRATVKKG
jgi:hypothetical protein